MNERTNDGSMDGSMDATYIRDRLVSVPIDQEFDALTMAIQ